MTQKFVVRLMDADDQLLAWCQVMATAKPQGQRRSCPFWPDHGTQFVIDESGIASKVVVHWCDLDLVRVQEIAATEVSAGQVFDYTWVGPVWLVAAPEKQQILPAVTVRAHQTIAPPCGTLTAKAS